MLLDPDRKWFRHLRARGHSYRTDGCALGLTRLRKRATLPPEFCVWEHQPALVYLAILASRQANDSGHQVVTLLPSHFAQRPTSDQDMQQLLPKFQMNVDGKHEFCGVCLTRKQL